MATTAQLYRACRVLFGQDVTLSREFLEYLQLSGLKVAYRRRALETHPDRFHAGVATHTHTAFLQVRNAYEMLRRFVETRPRVRLQPAAPPRTRPRPAPSRQPADHFYSGRIPTRELLIGQYLYYAGRISWYTIIQALAWQRAQRPRIGQIANQWGMLSERDVVQVLRHRQVREKFGDCALRLGWLSRGQLLAMISRQRQLQRRIGEYFVDAGMLTRPDMEYMALLHQRHNRRVPARPQRF